jgi:transcriptional regulator with XRE-family HTH domain
MEQNRPLTPTQVIAARVRYLRKRRGWTAAELARQMQTVGIPWERVVVTKLETGGRKSVSTEELLALSYVLNCAPACLFVPLDDGAPYQVTPDLAVPAAEARRWVRGWPQSKGLPGTDEIEYARNSPDSEEQVVIMTGREYDELEIRAAKGRTDG